MTDFFINTINRVKKELLAIWKIEKNRQIIKDVALLAIATVVFHFIYWHTNMNEWIFGPFSQTVYDFFRHLAFNLSEIPCRAFIKTPFDIKDTTYYFYIIHPHGMKFYNLLMEVNIDCSGVKQLLQFLLIMLLCRGSWKKKTVYYIAGCIIILFFNVVRIFLLTALFVDHPDLFQPVHDWIARPMMYIIIFSLWLIWITYFTTNKKENKSETKA